MRKLNILGMLFLFVAVLFTACEEEDRPYKTLTDGVTGGVVLFASDSYDFSMYKLGPTGEPDNATFDINIKVLGPPTNTDRTITLGTSDHGVVISGEDTIVPATDDMYELSTTQVVIKAGTTSQTIQVTLINEKLPLEEVVYFDLAITGGDIDLASNSTTTMVTMYKQNFCPILDVSDIVGAWSGSDAWYPSLVTTEASGNGFNVNISHLCENFMTDWWGEPYVAGGTAEMVVNTDGTLYIPDQYYVTTVWNGDNYDYDIINASGEWYLCNEFAEITLNYEIVYSADGWNIAAWGYSNGYLPAPYFTAEIQMDAKKFAELIGKSEIVKLSNLKELKESRK